GQLETKGWRWSASVPRSAGMNDFIKGLAPLLGWIGLFFVPVAVIAVLVGRAKRNYEAEAKEPFTDLPLRLPGESTRLAGERHFERGMEMSLLLIAASGFFGFAVAMMPTAQRASSAAVFGVIVLALAIIAGPRLL